MARAVSHTPTITIAILWMVCYDQVPLWYLSLSILWRVHFGHAQRCACRLVVQGYGGDSSWHSESVGRITNNSLWSDVLTLGILLVELDGNGSL